VSSAHLALQERDEPPVFRREPFRISLNQMQDQKRQKEKCKGTKFFSRERKLHSEEMSDDLREKTFCCCDLRLRT